MKFSKMHGLGNDFIIVNFNDLENHNPSTLALKLCHRHTGIGADGLVLVCPSKKSDIKMRIFNKDGSEAEMCGNAIRCFSKYIFDNKIISKKLLSIETLSGEYISTLNFTNKIISSVQIDMGKPVLDSNKIPMIGPSNKVINKSIYIKNKKHYINALNIGVPHTVIFIDEFKSLNIEKQGRSIEKADIFPEGTNVNFVKVINKNNIAIKTWERGAGATLSCATGACASVVASILNKKTDTKVNVNFDLGSLLIEWHGKNILMTGPAEYIFSGEIEI